MPELDAVNVWMQWEGAGIACAQLPAMNEDWTALIIYWASEHALVGTGRTRLTCTEQQFLATVWGQWLASGRCLRDPPEYPSDIRFTWMTANGATESQPRLQTAMCIWAASCLTHRIRIRTSDDDASHQNWNHNLHIFSWKVGKQHVHVQHRQNAFDKFANRVEQ